MAPNVARSSVHKPSSDPLLNGARNKNECNEDAAHPQGRAANPLALDLLLQLCQPRYAVCLALACICEQLQALVDGRVVISNLHERIRQRRVFGRCFVQQAGLRWVRAGQLFQPGCGHRAAL